MFKIYNSINSLVSIHILGRVPGEDRLDFEAAYNCAEVLDKAQKVDFHVIFALDLLWKNHY